MCKGNNIKECINNKTFNLEEIIKDVILGFSKKESLINQENLWTVDFTETWNGRAYTFNFHGRIGPEFTMLQLFVMLNYQLHYRIFIHDPKYFAINLNPVSLPHMMVIVNPNSTPSHYYRLALTEVEELNLPEDPCNTDPGYNFQTCVKESLSSQVGCRLSWDLWSDQDCPLCTHMEQYRSDELIRQIYLIYLQEV